MIWSVEPTVDGQPLESTMPTSLPKRLTKLRDRRLEFALLAVLAVEVVTMSAAGAGTFDKSIGVPGLLTAPLSVTCTAVEVPCAMLAP